MTIPTPNQMHRETDYTEPEVSDAIRRAFADGKYSVSFKLGRTPDSILKSIQDAGYHCIVCGGVLEVQWD